MPAVGADGQDRTARRANAVRLLAATLAGLVVGAALASVIAWRFAPAPTIGQVERAADELLPDGTTLRAPKVESIDSLGFGGRVARGRLSDRLTLGNKGEGKETVDEVRRRARDAGWSKVELDRARDAGTFLHTERGSALVELASDELHLVRSTPGFVPVIVLVGGVIGGYTLRRLGRRRQAVPETDIERRRRTAISSALLLPASLLAMVLPSFVFPGRSAAVGDYASVVVSGLVYFAPVWLPLAAIIGFGVWYISGRRQARLA